MSVSPENKCWSFTYECDGERFSFGIVAATHEEAERRLKSLRNATFEGEITPYVASIEETQQLSA